MSAFAAGTLVLYKGHAAAVRAVNGDKLDISIAGGAAKSVRPKDIVFLHRGPVSGLPPAEKPEPDCAELVELMDGETLSFAEFLECAFGEDTASAAWSAWKLLEAGVYFTGSPADGVTARPPEAVAASLAALRAKEAEAAERAALIARIRSGEIDRTADDGAVREIEKVALGAIPSSRLMRDLGMEADPAVAHALLLKLHCRDVFFDPFPARANIPTEDPDCRPDELPDDDRRDLTDMEAFAIDDAGSSDPDDAIGIRDGLLYVHVADPGAALAPDGPADLEARSRGCNLYLPNGTAHMLPREMTARFGLGLAETSPAWTFAVELEPDGRPVLRGFFPSRVRVSRHDYDTAHPLLDGPLAPAVSMLEKFRSYRKAQGALFIRMPEVKVRLQGQDLRIDPIGFSPMREFVAHAMLAAGAAVARYAAEHEIAMPFVIQPPAELPGPLAEDADLPAMHAARRACAPGRLSPWPGRHAGLGLEPYVRVTSPLRRYEDLLAHRQLRRVFRGETPMTFAEIEEAFVPAEDAAYARTRLERQVNEFYKLVWLQLHPDWRGEAVALAELDGGRTACILPDLAYEFTTRFANGKLVPGRRYPVAPEFVDPVTLTGRFRFVSE